MPHRDPLVTGVTAYGAPPPDDIYPRPYYPQPFPVVPGPYPNPKPAPAPGIGLPPLILGPTPEQVASAVMQRLEPALAEIHDRLDKIERRLPVTSEDREELDRARKAAVDLKEGIQKLLGSQPVAEEKAVPPKKTPAPKKK